MNAKFNTLPYRLYNIIDFPKGMLSLHQNRLASGEQTLLIVNKTVELPLNQSFFSWFVIDLMTICHIIGNMKLIAILISFVRSILLKLTTMTIINNKLKPLKL